jgi:molecular chaperone GrpE
MNEPQPTPATTSTATSSSSDAAAAQASDTGSLVNDTAALEAELVRKETDLAAAKKEAADHYERYLRSVADLDNLRKRAVREKDELRQYAASRVLEDLIPVLDNLSLGTGGRQGPNADLKTLVGGWKWCSSRRSRPWPSMV